jgi:hypothetical protein
MRGLPLLLIFWFPLCLQGQGCCSGGPPLSGSLGLEPIRSRQWQVESIFDYNTQQSLVSGTKSFADNPRNRLTYAGLLRVSYAFNARFSLTGLTSWVRQEERIERINGGPGVNYAQGLGDAVVLGQYQVLHKERYSWFAGLGITLPTGDTNDANPDTGIPFHPDMQAGRGAVDFIGSTLFTCNVGIRATSSLFAQVTYRFSRVADRYQGLQSYQFGNELMVLAGFGDQILIGKQLFLPAITAVFRTTQKDLINGLPSPNTGGIWWHLRFGLQWPITPNLETRGFIEAPVAWQLVGTQLTTSLRARLSLLYSWGAD